MDQPAKRPIVVVLGMHRSGTSLTANFLNAVGIDLGQDLLPPDEANEAGYWESQKILEIHQMILKELNCDWHNPPLSLPPVWWRKPKFQELKSGLLEFVRSECMRTENVLGFKDPRTAIVLPLWEEIFDELQLEPLYILTVRHPGSVAESLSKRDRLVSAHSHALWLKTNLDIISYAGDNLRAIVDYDRWFDSGFEQATTLINALHLPHPVNEGQIADAVNQVVHPGLRHHSGDRDETCPPIVAELYSVLLRATAEGQIPDEVSQITTTFLNSLDLLNIWNDLVAGRDEIIAGRDATIAERNAKIERLRGQRKLLIYVIVSIIAIFAVIFSFLLFGAHNLTR
jgi:hypothetical protein